jgi:hypothetical protein
LKPTCREQGRMAGRVVRLFIPFRAGSVAGDQRDRTATIERIRADLAPEQSTESFALVI